MECDAKREAALGLVAEFGGIIEDAEVIGVGTGSTVARAIEVLASNGLLDGKVLVATSLDTAMRLARMGFKPLLPGTVAEVDFYFDGADEVDPAGRLLKGRGGAMLGEKVIASISLRRVYIVDESKLVESLGSRRPVPLDVVPPAVPLVEKAVEALGFKAVVRQGGGKDGPAVSDWGGVIVDVYTGPLRDPGRVEVELESLPGVAASGLFTRLPGAIVVGLNKCGYKLLEPGEKQ